MERADNLYNDHGVRIEGNSGRGYDIYLRNLDSHYDRYRFSNLDRLSKLSIEELVQDRSFDWDSKKWKTRVLVEVVCKAIGVAAEKERVREKYTF